MDFENMHLTHIGVTRIAFCLAALCVAASVSAQADDTKVEEVVVTGTHIRGIGDSASPLRQIDRVEIEASGFATTEQLLRSLPQNFGGGATAMTGAGVRGGEGSFANIGQGTGVNLRGLGNDGTLVLVNGRRLAPVGVGNFVDISLIPLSAIERIDVLTDGASAIYGSDAVGGVVNIITRRSGDLRETRLRYGSVTDGGHHERQIGQLLGGQWGSGSASVAYEFVDHTPLSSRDRFPEVGDDPNDPFGQVEIVPPAKRQSALLSLTQNLADRVDLYADALYAERDTRSQFFAGLAQDWESHVKQYGGTIGTTVGLGSGWQADFAGGISRSETTLGIALDSVPIQNDASTLNVRSIDAKADGAIFDLPGGAARLAIGGHYRRETFDYDSVSIPTDMSRDVRAVFGELFVPLIGAGNRRSGVERLELTLAGRYEDYSDFGSTVDPKLGLLWSPRAGLSLRGTYGTSFRAPIFRELNENDVLYLPIPFPDPTPTDPTRLAPSIFIQGNNANLRPQEAENWTLGIDFSPAALSAFNGSLTYFDIDFKDRIAEPIPAATVFGGIFMNDPRYASFITRNPDIDTVNALFAHPRFREQQNGITPADITAIVDNRVANIARRQVKGFDLTMSYAWETSLGAFDARLGGSYLLDLNDQVTPDATFISPLNTVSFPVDLRLRNSLSWHRGRLGATAFLNYTDNYRDVRQPSLGEISSWTTVDLTVDVDLGGDSPEGWFSGLIAALSVQNLLDRDPPFAMALNGNGINFDPSNANPIGRFVAMQLRKGW